MVLLNLDKISKKAQVETLGLVIIVVIIAFVFVTALIFLSARQQPSLDEDYLKLNADNLRSTVLKTNICPNVDIKDEIVNCNYGFFECDNLNTCEDLNNIIQEVIQNSLPNIISNYEFSAGNILLKKGDCEQAQASSKQPISNTNIEVSLKLC